MSYQMRVMISSENVFTQQRFCCKNGRTRDTFVSSICNRTSRHTSCRISASCSVCLSVEHSVGLINNQTSQQCVILNVAACKASTVHAYLSYPIIATMALTPFPQKSCKLHPLKFVPAVPADAHFSR